MLSPRQESDMSFSYARFPFVAVVAVLAALPSALAQVPKPVTPGLSNDVGAVNGLTTPPDLAVDLVLKEPEVAQPVFLDFDERGRMCVVEYLQHPDPAGLKMTLRDSV